MANIYSLSPYKKGSDYMLSGHTSYTKEYADRVCDFYLEEEGRHTYRLCSGKPRRLADCLPLAIKCPKCSNNLTPVDAPIDSHTLLLYECRNCKKH